LTIIGITGKSGSGKSTVARILHGICQNSKHVNIDEIGYEALCDFSIRHELLNLFGTQILNADYSINRKLVGGIIFAEREKYKKIAKMIWHLIEQSLDKIISENHDILILEWILLPKVKYWEMTNIKIVVNSDEVTRFERIKKRSGTSQEYIDKREKASMEYSDVCFDYTIFNDGNEILLRERVCEIYEKSNLSR
jgi:dephospho-CoA kinase